MRLLTALLCLLTAGAAAQTQVAPPATTPVVRRVVLLRPDSAMPPRFPDTTWTEQPEAAPGSVLGVRIEVVAPDSSTASKWLGELEVSLYHSGAAKGRDTSLLAPAFFRGMFCAERDCDEGGVFAAFGYVSTLPAADTLLLLLASRGTTLEVPVWRRSPRRFVLGASLGASVPLNSVAGRSVVRRIGLNGRLIVGTLHTGELRCALRTWPFCLVQVVTYIPALTAGLAPHAHKWQGPFVVEGDFLLGLVALQTNTADSASAADSTQTFRQSSEGYVRIEFPAVDFSGDVSLRVFAQGGFVTVQSEPDYWAQEYFGMRLGMDAVDLSGRQSFVEIAYGLSENLRPRRGRLRVAVQLRVPDTGFIFQFNVNFRPGTGHRDPFTSDNPVVFSAYSSIDFQQLFTLVGGKPPT